jgi:ATP-dependent Clp protease ATP-binding subunit ClpC
MAAIWYRGDLVHIPARGTLLEDRLSADILGVLDPSRPITPIALWQAVAKHWQTLFITNHLLLHANTVAQMLPRESDMATIWQEASRQADAVHSPSIEPGHVAAALLISSPEIQQLLTVNKASVGDIDHIVQWLERMLDAMRAPKPYFGGIGRDWANGFTPNLNQYGENVSLSIERYGAHFSWLMASPGVQAMENAFSQGASAIALVGESGIGKTSHVYALAQLLLEGSPDRNLEHRQIVSLNPSLILSRAAQPGELERTIILLLQETVHAGHIVLFLDDARLFFRTGTGSFDITQILLPVIQNRAVQIVLAMTPQDYQQLKSTNSAFAGLLTPVILHEPDEAGVMHVLEDTAGNFEAHHGVLIAYEALREAYRLSGRYDQDAAYPGRAIRLLEQSLSHASQGIVTAASVQQAIEQTRGVKVGAAKPAEAAELLNLEAAIHRRMINQSRAVSVVANALRRARAGVSDPKRPIGSFLFLGPTGVGKTELARSIAATYFGAETNMIRLDMSEYQQQSDVDRLLSNGEHAQSLLMTVRQQPFSVVLLDEIEKAHPNILNLLLQLLDEGQLTDLSGRSASFKDTIIIATSNAGAAEIRERIEHGEQLETFERAFIDNLISSSQFKPELLNRFDEIVLFRPLTPEELLQVVTLMLAGVNKTLANQNITVELTKAAAEKIVAAGYDPRLGARPLRRALQRAVEDSIAARILRGETKPGDHVVLDAPDVAPQNTL